jgi:hypothetical protein
MNKISSGQVNTLILLKRISKRLRMTLQRFLGFMIKVNAHSLLRRIKRRWRRRP